MPEARSPLQEGFARLVRQRSAVAGLVAIALIALVAIYAPFIAGETALAWRQGGRWSFPVLGDLFNQWSYAKPHDLLFNLIALELPFLAIAWLALRRRLPGARIAKVAAAIVLASWIGCWVPLPTGHGWQAAWRKRPIPQQTVGALADARRSGATDDVVAVFPPIPHRFDTTFTGATLKPPLTPDGVTGHRFLLGTDSGGKDVLAQMVFGARISLTVGLFATAISMAIGVLIGGVSGYFGGRVDLVLQRLVEIMMCFPTFVLILVLVAMLGRDIFKIMAVIGIIGWAGTARLVRGEFLAHSVRDYVAAAEALGLPRWRIMFRHILPNALTPLLISATFSIAGAVLGESGLAFIGLGDPTSASWGILMEEGRKNIAYGWLIYAPGIAVFVLITALNLIGNGLREALDPKSTA